MFFLAQFVHRDLVAWRAHLAPHTTWPYEQERTGAIAASGPVLDPGDGLVEAMILLRAADERAAHAVLQTDPFVIHGITEDLVLRGWNPFIGTFANETDPPPQLAELLAQQDTDH